MKSRSGKKIEIKGIEDLFGLGGEEISAEIEIAAIKPFEKHPFHVVDDEKMEDLVESIQKYGVLSPVLVRPYGIGRYEMISGHRRMHAAKKAGLTFIPAIVRELSDDEATIVMVDTNIQREELLPSEKAFALKMKHEAMKRQGARSDLTSDQNGPKLTVVQIGQDTGMSPSQVKRYIRLTYLNKELLELVDHNRLSFTCAVEISYFNQTIQSWLNEYIRENVYIKPAMIEALKDWAKKEELNQYEMIQILISNIPGKKITKKVVLSPGKLKKYFPEEYSVSQMEGIIEKLLEQWSKENGGEER